MDSRYVGRHFWAPVGHRKYAEARGSKHGKNVISILRSRVGMCHEMELRLTFGVLAPILDMKQLPEVARVRWRVQTPDYPFFENTSWAVWSSGTLPRISINSVCFGCLFVRPSFGPRAHFFISRKFALKRNIIL